MRVLLTGGAGFVGSNLALKMLQDGHEIVAADNLYLGKLRFLEPCHKFPAFNFVQADLLDLDNTIKLCRGCDIVIHLAANSDISLGRQKTDLDLQLGYLTTYNLLEGMRIENVPEIIFASSSAIYGEADVVPTPESFGPLCPISLYGASKLAAEGLITAFAHNFGKKAWIFRFGNVIGPNVTHGIFYDFVNRLRSDSSKLRILGDGRQAKPYIHVTDLISGILFAHQNSSSEINIFNLATSGNSSVKFIADTIVEEMGLNGIPYEFTGTAKGWIGDVAKVALDVSRLGNLGWKTKLTSDEAIRLAAKEVVSQFKCGIYS
ncbi:MAG: NAD-dependent epimerase/dehydratase family protein [Fibrobacteres bacterium]|nr:NAD-dependent epimerase/dehydratase family protein [Fibrobacterota bacterium]